MKQSESKSSPPPPALEGDEEELRALLEKYNTPWIRKHGHADFVARDIVEKVPALLSALAGMREENGRLQADLTQALEWLEIALATPGFIRGRTGAQRFLDATPAPVDAGEEQVRGIKRADT